MHNLMLAVAAVLCGAVIGTAAPTADMDITPGTSVRVGEEVLFEAGNTIVSGIIQDGRYYWDFGDGYVFGGEPGAQNNGLVTSHFYMNPGAYTARLIVMDPDSSLDTAFETITVSGDAPLLAPRPDGDPALFLPFDGDLTDASANGLDGAWQNGTGGFVRGASGEALSLDGEYVTVADAGGALSGSDRLSVSVWARFADRTASDQMYLLYKSGAFHMRVVPDDWSINVGVVTENGGVGINRWLASASDARWHQYAMRWDGTRLIFYVDGSPKDTATGSGAIAASTEQLEVGARGGSYLFDGYIDDVKVYGDDVGYDGLFKKFELWHADFHGRIAQYAYAQVPPAVTGDATNRILAVLSDSAGYDATLLDKAALDAEEAFLLRPGDLDAGTYTLTVELQESDGTLIERIIRQFTKEFDGIPPVGIDENNAVRVDGELFFPIAPFILATSDVQYWGDEGYINTVYSLPWYSSYGVSSWQDYVGRGARAGCMAMGPGGYDGKGSPNLSYMERNADPAVMREFVAGTRDSANMLFWIWDDEPDLGGDTQYIPAQTIRGWTRLSHGEDARHPVATNLVGPSFIKTGWHRDREGKFNFRHNARIFGRRTHLTDVYCMDYYPFDWEYNGATVWKMAAILDTMRNWNRDMVPYMSFIETSNIKDDVGREVSAVGTPPPTAAQLKMLTWLNVVHGCKGINWFQHFTETSAENFAFMAEFGVQTAALAPAILSPETDYTVTSDDAARGVRIDHMVREYDDALYLFAVRLTEVAEIDDPTATVTFTLPAELTMTYAEVYGESRSIALSGNSFSDDFDANGVHVYRIPFGDTICIDLDEDGYCSALSTPAPAHPDCDDTNATVNPGAPELCDGIDNNCSGAEDEGFPQDDTDADGYLYCVDNCPDAYNPLQADFDYDGIGDSCDTAFTWFEDFELRDAGTRDLGTHKRNNDFTWANLYPAAGITEGAQWLRSSFYTGGNAFVATDQTFGAYTLELDVRMAWALASNTAGLTFHVQDNKNYYFLCMGGSGEELFDGGGSGIGIYEVVDGTGTLVAQGDMRMPHQDDANVSHYMLDIRTSGSDLLVDVSYKRMYGDSTTGSHSYVIANPAYASGSFGFYAHAADYNHFYIDNVALETAEFPVYTSVGSPFTFDPAGTYGLGLYPNPFSGKLFVPSCVTRGTVRVMDMHGVTVGVFPFANGELALPADTRFEPGMHLVEIEGVPGIQRIMVVK